MKKNSLNEALENLLIEEMQGQMEIDETGLPVLERPYRIRDRQDGRLQITSSHPYDLTDYSWAYSTNMNPMSEWTIVDPDTNECTRVQGYHRALEVMKEIDNKKTSRIDRT